MARRRSSSSGDENRSPSRVAGVSGTGTGSRSPSRGAGSRFYVLPGGLGTGAEVCRLGEGEVQLGLQ